MSNFELETTASTNVHPLYAHNLVKKRTLNKDMIFRFLGNRVCDHNLWHIDQQSVSGAVFWGLLCSFLLLPIQFIPATIGAVYFRINLPITLLMTWCSNPLTVLPILYIAYWVGTLFIPAPMINLHDLSFVFNYIEAFVSSKNLPEIPASVLNFNMFALLLGLMIEALIVSVFGLLCVKLLWGNKFLTRFFLGLLHHFKIHGQQSNTQKYSNT